MNAASVFPLPQCQRLLSVAIFALAGTLLTVSAAIAQPLPTAPYFPSPYSNYTTFSALEAVSPSGSSSFTFPSNGSPITVMGNVLNNPSDMLNTTPNYNQIPWDLGGEWQIFIQAYHDSTVGGDPTDFGGAEVWMGQCYGNLGFISDPNDVYTNCQWSTVVADLNHPPLWPSSGTISLQESSSSSTGSPAVWQHSRRWLRGYYFGWASCRRKFLHPRSQCRLRDSRQWYPVQWWRVGKLLASYPEQYDCQSEYSN